MTDRAMIELLRRVYSGKTVFVTGHTGFKGSWLGLWLLALGARVVGYSLGPPSQPNLFEAIDLKGAVSHYHGDVREYERMEEVLLAFSPEIVFHMAAQSLVRQSYSEPRLTYDTNVMGTVNLLEAVRHCPSTRAVVIVTSDKCYENLEWVWGYREIDPLGGDDPYASSKGCAELVGAAYQKSFFRKDCYGRSHRTAIASARAGNVIGGGDWGKDRLIPDCVRAFSEGRAVAIRCPHATRPWQYVLEPLGGYLLLGAKLFLEGPEYSGAWNFGPHEGQAWTVEQVVHRISQAWGGGAFETIAGEHPQEADRLRLDCSKAKVRLGWSARYDVEQAITNTVKWYRMFYSGVSPKGMLDFTMKQIEDFADAHSPSLRDDTDKKL